MRKIVRLPAILLPVFVLAFGFALLASLDPIDGTLATPTAYAKGKGGGNGAGNGNGKGRSDAPGQAEQDVTDDGLGGMDSATDPAAAVAGGDSEVNEPSVPEIAEDRTPASILVIKELAGLPEQSALSEEEEADAIRSGWGTWRTADGPETMLSQ